MSTADHASIPQRFAEGYGFPLDPFQQRAVDALLAGRSVLVAAPTGAGKTVVGEFACFHALAAGGRCFYTTPIKALSNQKYRDLADRHGDDQVGLLTGDRSIHGDAPVVVMTTEVLRNMIYEGSVSLRTLRYVVLDEVHYLSDRARGAVWEEVITQVPATVQLAALSATVSNAEEFGEWLSEVREGGCEVVIEERRPVPLRHHYYVNDRIHPTFVSTRKGKQGKEARERAAQALAGVPNPKVLMLERQGQRSRGGGRGRRMGPPVRLRWPSRATVVTELADRGWLPAIVFVFSRTGCEKAVDELLRSGISLTTPDARRRIADIVEEAVAGIPGEDLQVLGYSTWLDALMHGVAAHHAGLVPAFKEAVETAFQQGLLDVVVATETLALGINMPAKSVVIERLEKWNGERHVLLTPGEYTQLTGRAGRRGIDPVGHAIVLYQRDIDFRTVAGLVGTRAYPLTSSFAPSYNIAVNLLRRHDLEHAERLLTASFAQFQTDRSMAGIARRVAELEDGMAGYRPHLHCSEGDWAAYWSLRRELTEREKRETRHRQAAQREAVEARIARLNPGDVVHWPAAPGRGLAAVVGASITGRGTVLARVVTEDRQLARLGPRDVDAPPERVAAIELPADGNPRQPTYRAKVAALLDEVTAPAASAGPSDDGGPISDGVRDLRRQLRDDPVHRCPDRAAHERWQLRYDEVSDEHRRLHRRLERESGSLVRQLHRILRVLTDLGYVDETPAPTPEGMRLAGIYADVDLVVAECLREGVLDGLSPAEVAGMCALFVYESRTDEPTVVRRWPSAALATAVDAARAVFERIAEREVDAGLQPTRDLDPGFVGAAYRWATLADLDTAIGQLELTGGDFVRNVKQVADLAGQVRDVSGGQLRAAAAEAVDLLRRGVVEA
ncbi:MAG: DEAD/DEAH box helicase [Actinomycetota bacterium]|nr:DEAD/DEAH box helicase [Actinomycetota bacterium]